MIESIEYLFNHYLPKLINPNLKLSKSHQTFNYLYWLLLSNVWINIINNYDVVDLSKIETTIIWINLTQIFYFYTGEILGLNVVIC